MGVERVRRAARFASRLWINAVAAVDNPAFPWLE